MDVYVLPVGPLQTNCYFLASTTGNAAVIDPGDEFEKIYHSLTQYNLTPTMVLLTHGHFDHIGAVGALREKFGLPVYIHQADEVLLGDTRRNRARYFKVNQANYQFTPDYHYTEGQTIALDELNIEVLHTPGHTRGGVCLRCESMLFVGDTLFPNDCGRWDLEGGNREELLASLQKLRALPGDFQVLPGHGPATTLEQERHQNPYMQPGSTTPSSWSR